MVPNFASLFRTRGGIIGSLLLVLQSLSSLIFAALIAFIGVSAVGHAAALHKATAAALITGFTIFVGGFFIGLGLLELFLAWWLWRRAAWALHGSVILEVFSLLACLALLHSGANEITWFVLSEAGIVVAALLCLLKTRL